MPLNATTYLEQHGWRGKGIPLDGEKGRGLKKPLALPMKRNLKGVGKERDRAVEWWDCLFEAGAKKLQTSPANPSSIENAQNDNPNSKQSMITSSSSSLSLAALAKREHARKLLMNGFVRGRPNEEYENKMKDLEKTLAQQEEERLAAKAKLVQHSALINSHGEEGMVSTSDKAAEKVKRKEQKKREKEASKQKQKESKTEKDYERKKEKKKEKTAGESVGVMSTKQISIEDKEKAEKRQKKERKRKEKEERKAKKQKKDSRKNSAKIQDPSRKLDKENRKRKRSSDEKDD